MNNDKSIEKIINEQFLNKKDFLYIKNIRTHGIKYLNNCFINNYEKDKNLINTYSLIYLSNNVFNISCIDKKVSNNLFILNEINYFKQLIIENNKFVTNLILEDDFNIKIIKNNFINNIIKIIFSLFIKKKIKIYKNLFELTNFTNYILNESNYWNSIDDTIIGNIINNIDLNDKFYINLGRVFNFIKTNIFISKEILNWFEYIILKNINYKKTYNLLYLNNNLSPLSFLNKMVIFNIELYKIDKKLNNKDIDINIFYDKICSTWWDKSDNNEYYDMKLNENLEIDYSFNTRMFLYTHQLLEISIIPSIEKFNLFNKEKIRLNNLIKNEQNFVQFKNYPILKRIYLNKIKQDYNNIIKNIYEIIIILDNKYLIDSILYFLNDTSKFILNNKNKFISRKFIKTIIIILNYYQDIIKEFIINDNLINLLELLIDIINNKFKNTNIYIKNDLIIFLSYNTYIFFNLLNIDNLEYYIQGLIKLYIDICKNNEESEIYNARNNINYILNDFLKYYNEKNIIINFSNINHLFFLLISDTNYYFEECINLIKQLENSNNNTTLISQLSTFINCLKNGLDLISKIIDKFNNQIGKSNINIEKFVNFINFWNIKLFKSSILTTFNFKQYNIIFDWDIIYIITKIVYLTFYNNKIFIKFMKNDKIFFDEGILSNFNLNLEEKDKLNVFIEKIKKSRNKLYNTKKYINEFPEELCDPILYTRIKDPVILPESKLFMDFLSISNHLLVNEFDPFNRTKLTMKELKEFNLLPENIKKIELFKNKIANWKKENRIDN